MNLKPDESETFLFEINWSLKLLGARSELADAEPGTILFVVGLFYVFVTRFVVKADKVGR
jgi:hypothetical protein